MDIILKIREELKVEKWQVEAAVKLIDEGNTIPFISRYRKGPAPAVRVPGRWPGTNQSRG